MKDKLPDDLLRALAEADRTLGWNGRGPDVKRFELAGKYGQPCTLFVVPFRRWAYRRAEKSAQEWQREHDGFADAG